MNRWWTDPVNAYSTLERVDSSDPIQGVGTAVLGYHGLSEGILRPLTTQTLLDVNSVSQALESLDLAPVAKAMANATRSVVGESADRYGELLAKDLHDRAVESTGRLILNLVSTGMAWPTAIDRAASVHGVPTERLGKAGSVLRAPALAKMAQADISDRALMEYARHVGHREYTPELVSKSERKRERPQNNDFDEDNVNRDALGRFADKPNRSLAGLGANAKSDFLDRQARRQRRRKNQANSEKQNPVSDLMAALMARDTKSKSKPAVAVNREVKTVPKDPRDAQAEAMRNKVIENAQNKVIDNARQRLIDRAVKKMQSHKLLTNIDTGLSDDLMKIPDDIKTLGTDNDGNVMYPGHVLGSPHGFQYLMVDKNILEQVASVGGFNVAQLQKSGGLIFNEVMSKDTLQLAVMEYSKNPDNDLLENLSILALDGAIAYDLEYTQGRHVELAKAGVYNVSARNKRVGIKGLEYDDYLDLELEVYVTPGMTSVGIKEINFPHLTVVLDSLNEKRFTAINLNKSDQWRESDVNRDRLGRFADENENASMKDPDEERKARMARRKRRRSRQSHRQQVQSNDLVAALRARDAVRSRELPQKQSQTTQISDNKVVDVRDQVQDAMRERVIVRARQQMLDKAKEKVAQRKNSLVAFKNNYDEWKELKAARFSYDDDMATFTEIFDFDPYSGKSFGLKGVADAQERLETIDFVLDAKLRSSNAVIEGMYNTSINTVIGEPFGTEEVGDGKWAQIAVTADAAYMWAEAAADEMNSNTDDPTRQFMPFVDLDTEWREQPMYKPMLVEVLKREEDVVVLGSDAAWAAVRNGKEVTLEPLPGYDEDNEQPGQGLFSALFQTVGDEESVKRDNELHDINDFYVRAFRIKT